MSSSDERGRGKEASRGRGVRKEAGAGAEGAVQACCSCCCRCCSRAAFDAAGPAFRTAAGMLRGGGDEGGQGMTGRLAGCWGVCQAGSWASHRPAQPRHRDRDQGQGSDTGWGGVTRDPLLAGGGLNNRPVVRTTAGGGAKLALGMCVQVMKAEVVRMNDAAAVPCSWAQWPTLTAGSCSACVWCGLPLPFVLCDAHCCQQLP